MRSDTVNMSEYVSSELHTITQIDFPNDGSVTILALLVTLSVLTVVGVLGNALVLLAVGCNAEMRHSNMNLLLFNLAFADLGNLLSCSVDWLQQLTTYSRRWILPAVFCPITRYIQVVCLYCSIASQVAVSVERFIAIVYPMRLMLCCTRGRTVIVCLAIWTGTLVLATPYAINTGVVPRNVCANVWPKSAKQHFVEFKIFECLFFYFSPMVAITTFYYRISAELSVRKRQPRTNVLTASALSTPVTENPPTNATPSQQTFETAEVQTPMSKYTSTLSLLRMSAETSTMSAAIRRGSERLSVSLGQHAERQRRNVVRMLIASVGIYFICYSPIQYHFLSYFAGLPSLPDDSLELTLLLNVLATCNSACNPMLYSLFSEKFRNKFTQLLRCQTTREMRRQCASASSFIHTQSTRKQYRTRMAPGGYTSETENTNRRRVVKKRSEKFDEEYRKRSKSNPPVIRREKGEKCESPKLIRFSATTTETKF